MISVRALGPLEVDVSGKLLNLGGPREHVILAMLLLDANRIIPIERLMRALWDDRPPNTARAQVQICISALRKKLLPVGGAIRIESHRPGYLIRLPSEFFDLHVFEAAVVRARNAEQRGDLNAARSAMRRALGLWRGGALAGIESRTVRQIAEQLAERRLALMEDCLDVELQLGLHNDVAVELARLVEEYPHRERLCALLMTALYRAGRQADALEVYRRTRASLVDALGIEPGAELRRLHLAILQNSEASDDLEAHAIDLTAGARAPAVVPTLLPATISDFTGRADQVARLMRQVLRDTSDIGGHWAVGVNVIVGRGGTGKTTLAVHVAHQLADKFPDGQLFARLRSGDQAASLAGIFERFLRALGAQNQMLPDSVDERAEMYRDLLADRRVLVLLDDAMSEQQVRDLLPGSPTCAVIVTSRKRLTGLSAANRVELGGFDPATAIELLGTIAGRDRIACERAAAARVCQLCDYTPLALRIVGARLAARPHWTVDDMVGRLTDESRRLDELRHEQMGVRASMALSYVNLSPAARCLLRRLALLETSSFAPWVGEPLIKVDEFVAQEIMEELVDAYFLDADSGLHVRVPRYRLHDITRIFAQERLTEEDAAAESRAAVSRYIAALHYLTREAYRRAHGGEFLLPKNDAELWRLAGASAARQLAEPLAWLEEERGSLVCGVRQAAAYGLTDHAWGLALSSVAIFEARMHLDDWRETHEDALRAVLAHGDVRGEAAIRYSLASLHMFTRNVAEASDGFSRALVLYEDLGDRYGTALVLRNVAYLDRIAGHLSEALERWEKTLPAFREVNDVLAVAHVLHNMAQVKMDFGDIAGAVGMLDEADEICTMLGNRRVGAQVLHRKGELYCRRGDLEQAAAAYADVLASAEASGDLVGQCYALLGLNSVHVAREDFDAAARTLAQADELAVSAGDPMVRCRLRLARAIVALGRGDLESAARDAESAVRDAKDMNATLLCVEALMTRGRICLLAGKPECAQLNWDSCADLVATLEARLAARLSAELQRYRTAALSAAHCDGPAHASG
jgi:DNA-binding SARP family transcriptional activator